MSRSIRSVVACSFVALCGCASGVLGERPTITTIDVPDPASDQITLTITLSDLDQSVCSLRVQFWTAGNAAWTDATLHTPSRGSLSGTGTVRGVDVGKAPAVLTIVWDSWADDVALTGDDATVRIRVTPRDGDGEGVYAETAAFTANNFIPEMLVTPATIAIEHGLGDADPVVQLAIANVGLAGTMLQWELAGLPAWLTPDIAQGDISGGTDAKVALTADPTGLAEGIHTGSLTVQDRVVGNPSHASPVTVQISVTIGRPTMAVDVTSLAFDATQDQMAVSGWRDPPAHSIVVSNNGPAYTNLAWSLTKANAWLVASPPSGTVPGGQTQAVTISADVIGEGLRGWRDHAAAGNLYTDTIVIADTRGVVPTPTSRSVPVTMQVRWQRPDILVHDGAGEPVEVTAVTFECVKDLTTPEDQTIYVKNASPEPDTLLDWMATKAGSDSDWLTVSPDISAAPLAVGASQGLVLAADSTGLAKGTYGVDLTVSGDDDQHVDAADETVSEPALTGDKVVHVTLLVKEPASIALTPSSITFDNAVYGLALPDPASKSLTMTNPGGIPLNWTSAWTGTTPTWVTCPDVPTPTPTALAAGGSKTFTFTVTNGVLSLAQGTHTATGRFTNTATGNPTYFTVSVTVGRRDLVVSGVTYSPTYPSPGSNMTFVVTVRNDGTIPSGPFTLRFWNNYYIEPASFVTLSYSSLAAGASGSATAVMTAPTNGAYYNSSYNRCYYRAHADYDGLIVETSETNNTYGRYYYVTRY